MSKKISRVFFSVGHVGKISSPFDLGAVYDGYKEGIYVLKYVSLAYESLLNAGIEAFILAYGSYFSRQKWANAHNQQNSIYLETHLNAGGGNYPLVAYNQGSMQKTKDLAGIFAEKFNEVLTIPNDINKAVFGAAPAQIWELSPEMNGYANIKETKMTALLLEPLFIDNPGHLIQIKQPEKIAAAIVEAILAVGG